MSKDIIDKILKSFCSVKSVLTLLFGVSLIIFTSRGIIDGEKYLSIATLLIGSLVGAAGKNTAIEQIQATTQQTAFNNKNHQDQDKDDDSAADVGEPA